MRLDRLIKRVQRFFFSSFPACNSWYVIKEIIACSLSVGAICLFTFSHNGRITVVYHYLSVLSAGEDPSIDACLMNWTSFTSSVLSTRAKRLMHAAASYCNVLEVLR